MSELKPCPFCGGIPAVVEDGYKAIAVHCFNCGADITAESEKKARAAWNRRAQPANEPLTLKELREMDGEPVWCADGEGHSCYCLVNAESEDCIDSECGAWCFGFYGMTGDGENGLHNMGWLAYDHKPGGEQDA